MAKGLGLLSPDRSASLPAVPPPKLLVELEPAHRVFWRNLTDTLKRRPAPRWAITSKPAPFWNDVFVYSGVPWWSFLESMMWHTLMVAAVWSLSQGWALQKQQQLQRVRQSYVTYYPTFPTLGSSGPRERTRSKGSNGATHRPAISVPSSRPGLVAPPAIKLPQSGLPNLGASSAALPAMPLAATGSSRLTLPAGSASVVAPPPDVGRAATGRSGFSGLAQASVVGPAPDVGAASGRRALAGSSAGVVPPSPTLQGSIREFGDVNIGHSDVVAPAPRLPMHEQRSIPGVGQANLGGMGTSVVPPPPSVEGSGTAMAAGRAGSLSGAGAGMRVVPPPPSVTGAGNSAGTGRGRSISGPDGVQVVPPPPTLSGAGLGAGKSVGGGRVSSLSGGGSRVVPPPPSVSGAGPGGGNSVGGGRAGSLSGIGSQGVALPQSGQGGGNGGGRADTPSGAGSPGGSSSATVETAANSTPSGTMPMDTHTSNAPAPPPVVNNPHEPSSQELPVRLIGLALSLPSSSYFSNYEVFLAERRLSKDESQLIKLVYVFLPYQRRLSEYGLGSAKAVKLRVKRDPTCDETLLQMTWPEADQAHAQSQEATDPAAEHVNNRNSMLPCYRTTADDYRKAISRAR